MNSLDIDKDWIAALVQELTPQEFAEQRPDCLLQPGNNMELPVDFPAWKIPLVINRTVQELNGLFVHLVQDGAYFCGQPRSPYAPLLTHQITGDFDLGSSGMLDKPTVIAATRMLENFYEKKMSGVPSGMLPVETDAVDRVWSLLSRRLDEGCSQVSLPRGRSGQTDTIWIHDTDHGKVIQATIFGNNSAWKVEGYRRGRMTSDGLFLEYPDSCLPRHSEILRPHTGRLIALAESGQVMAEIGEQSTAQTAHSPHVAPFLRSAERLH